MQLGLHLADLTFPGGPRTLGRDLADVAKTAEAAGFSRISVMDHLWQIEMIGAPEQEMLEAYTTLGYLAAATERVELLAWVTAATYRRPGMLAKLVTTLDVLSGGRAALGIGAGWFEQEANGLGLPFPSTGERFEHLEETLQICLQMWDQDDEGAYEGKHHKLARTLNSPQSLHRPHPPILIGGGGEKKTLRLVAQYAQACNLFPGPELEHKLQVLRGHCEDVGRPYDEIEKTVMMPLDAGARGEKADAVLQRLRDLAAQGVTHVQGMVPGVAEPGRLDVFADRIIPEAAAI